MRRLDARCADERTVKVHSDTRAEGMETKPAPSEQDDCSIGPHGYGFAEGDGALRCSLGKVGPRAPACKKEQQAALQHEKNERYPATDNLGKGSLLELVGRQIQGDRAARAMTKRDEGETEERP